LSLAAKTNLHQGLILRTQVKITENQVIVGVMAHFKSRSGDRRKNKVMPRVKFKDSNGITISACRRRKPDRRIGNIEAELISEATVSQYALKLSYDKTLIARTPGMASKIPNEIADRLAFDKEHPLKVWREYRGMSQEQLGAIAAISTAQIALIEAGMQRGSIPELRVLAGVLDVELDDLITDCI